MNIRKNLIELRKNKGLTQSLIAKELNISERHYQAIEAGTSYGSIQFWIKLSKFLDEKIDYLLK